MRRLLLSLLVVVGGGFSFGAAADEPSSTPQAAAAAKSQTSTFASTIASLSEPGGFFNTDNLISNERSYLHVVPELRALKAGGVYLGVGPDQNFSYIAHARPSLAILIDIRRDNLLLHLLFKALFAQARTRVEYLALLAGRAPPDPVTGWDRRPIEEIVAYVDRAPRPANIDQLALRDRLAKTIRSFGVPMTSEELGTIFAFHARFMADGLSLQFNTTGRSPQFDYPTYRDLLLELDRAGAKQNFFASEESFQFVKSMQARDLVIPITGDLAGPTALANIARYLTTRKERVSAFYTSNVEFYLFRGGTFAQFITNLERLPRDPAGVIIRSVFPSGGGTPFQVPGYNSASLTQSMQVLVDGYRAGRFRQYFELTQGR